VIRSLGGRVRRAAVLRLVAIAALATLPRALHAQAPAPDDSVFTRAKALVQAGNAAAGRLLVDSVLATRSPDSLSYADALFWRASLAASNVDAARDYGRIIVDYPLSPRSADALLQLAQIEQVQSDNDRAAEHLHRFLLENPDHPERGRASYMLAELLLARNDMPRGCTELAHAQRAVPDSLVELRNRIAFDAQRCVGVDTTNATVGAQPADSAAAPSASPPTRARGDSSSGSEPTGGFTVQVGAFPSRTAADALAAKLRKRGYEARVVSGKLNRVQIGSYSTRSAATTEAKRLKGKGISGFVTERAGAERAHAAPAGGTRP